MQWVVVSCLERMSPAQVLDAGRNVTEVRQHPMHLEATTIATMGPEMGVPCDVWSECVFPHIGPPLPRERSPDRK